MSPSLFHRHIALPQEHGAWVFILSPLLIGLFAGGRFTLASAALVIAALAAFFLRQPMTITVKAYSGRRPRHDLPGAYFWTALYGLILLIVLGGLIVLGYVEVLFLTIPGIAVFIWHLYLVSRRAERRQAGAEIVATGALALAAPAAYWVGLGKYDPLGWILWLLVWLQSAASIVHAYLRLGQRDLPEVPPRPAQWRIGRRALLYTSFDLLFSIGLGMGGLIPRWIFIPYALQWVETIWGVTHPAVGVKPTRIGLRQLAVSTLFTVLFILLWR